jgi:hypothetical protein
VSFIYPVGYLREGVLLNNTRGRVDSDRCLHVANSGNQASMLDVRGLALRLIKNDKIHHYDEEPNGRWLARNFFLAVSMNLAQTPHLGKRC